MSNKELVSILHSRLLYKIKLNVLYFINCASFKQMYILIALHRGVNAALKCILNPLILISLLKGITD